MPDATPAGAPGPCGGGVCVGIVEQCRERSGTLDQQFTVAGYTVQRTSRTVAASGLLKPVPDILVLDWVAGETGLELLRQLRLASETKWVPIIILTERADEHDVVSAFGAGADDVLPKPVSVPELFARVEALLRRRLPVKTSNVVTVGDTEFDREAVLVRRRGKTIALGPTERHLLDLFMTHPGKVLGRPDILLAVWGAQGGIDARTIDVHVGRLRKALLTAWRSDPITTVRGTGYRFDPK
jgi:two-component system, OmpR family, phosphate regulon response regulator PhoB